MSVLTPGVYYVRRAILPRTVLTRDGVDIVELAIRPFQKYVMVVSGQMGQEPTARYMPYSKAMEAWLSIVASRLTSSGQVTEEEAQYLATQVLDYHGLECDPRKVSLQDAVCS